MAYESKHELCCNNKVYKVSKITDGVKDAWEKHLFRRAKECAKELKDMYEKDEYQTVLKDLANDYSAGKYAFESPHSIDTLQSEQGVLALASLLFGIDKHEMISVMMENQDEVQSVLHTVLKESFPDKIWKEADEAKDGTDLKKS